jgi:hypothetical protein
VSARVDGSATSVNSSTLASSLGVPASSVSNLTATANGTGTGLQFTVTPAVERPGLSSQDIMGLLSFLGVDVAVGRSPSKRSSWVEEEKAGMSCSNDVLWSDCRMICRYSRVFLWWRSLRGAQVVGCPVLRLVLFA